MKMTKLLAGVAAAALLGGAASAYDVVLGNTAISAAGTDIQGPTAYRVADNVDFSGNPNQIVEFFIEQTAEGIFTTDDVLVEVVLTNGTFAANVTNANFDATCATSASVSSGGAAGTNSVTLLVSGFETCDGKGALAAGTFTSAQPGDFGFSIPVTYSGGGDVTIDVNVETDSGNTPVDGGNASVVAIDSVNAFTLAVAAAGTDPVADLDAANGIYTDFDGVPAGSTLAIGGFNVVCDTTANINLTGTAVDCSGAQVDGLDLALTGSTLGFDDGNGIQLFDNVAAAAGNFTIVDATSSTFDAAAELGGAGLAGVYTVEVTSDQDDAILRSDYSLEVTLDLDDTIFTSDPSLSGDIDPIVREGSNVIAAWTSGGAVATANNSQHVFRFGNLSNADARVFVEVLTASDGTFVNPGLVQLSDIPAGGELVLTSGTLTTALTDDWGRGDLQFTIEATGDQVTARRFVTAPNGSLTELGLGNVDEDLDG